jgi:hypothetical protein
MLQWGIAETAGNKPTKAEEGLAITQINMDDAVSVVIWPESSYSLASSFSFASPTLGSLVVITFDITRSRSSSQIGGG